MAADEAGGDERDELRALVGQLRTNLGRRQRSGLMGVPRTPSARKASPAATPAIASAPLAATPPAVAAMTSDEGGTRPVGAMGLTLVREELGDCQRCKLAPLRTKLVFGVGNPNAHLVFVGEAPGADEDARGEPFVGRAGQLLTDIIERGMGLKRSDVYICNVIKCRPPDNRNPEPDEVAACEPFLMRQIDLVRPRAIVALGTFAVQALLKVKTPISRLRGNWHEVRGVKLMPTFHPAYLLRSPGEKRWVWQDIQEVMKVLGIELPARGGAR